MNLRADCEQWNGFDDRISSILIVLISILRGLSLLLSARPKTLLRLMCIMAFDTLHALRNPQRLPMHRLGVLAALIDFEACVNAALDNKDYRRHECRRALQLLEAAGIQSPVIEYLQRLRDVEGRRPSPGGDPSQFHNLVLYREDVIRLSLGMVAATAYGSAHLDDGIRATCCDAGLNILFRIAMLCQIIDDVLDYRRDLSAGLPTFLTACGSLPQSFELTRLAALEYADDRDLPRTDDLFPLRAALFLASTCTKLVMALGRVQLRTVSARRAVAASVNDVRPVRPQGSFHQPFFSTESPVPK